MFEFPSLSTNIYPMISKFNTCNSKKEVYLYKKEKINMELIYKEFIDPPTISCHAGAITYFKGERLMSWFGGDVEGCSNTDIYLKCGDRSPYPLNLNYNNYPAWNPIFVHVGRRLFLFYKVGIFCDSWQTFYKEYKDGKLISPVHALPAGTNGPSKTPPPHSIGNMVIFGSSSETFYKWSSCIEVFSFKKGMFHFQDRSHPIEIIEQGGSGGIIQPSLICDDDGTLHGFFRSKRSGILYGCDNNNFSTLSKLCDGPNSSVSAVYHKGFVYLACNTDPVSRLPLVIRKLELCNTSQCVDAPKIKDTIVLETEVDYSRFDNMERVVIYPRGPVFKSIGTTPEASYPYMIVNPEGNLELMYTYGRRTLRHVEVKI